MKLRNHSLAICTMLLLGSASFIGGCATTGMERSAKTSNSIRDVDSEIRKFVVQSDVTATSLQSLVMTGQPDIEKTYKAYANNVDKLEDEGQRVLKRIEEMKSNSKEYFAEWEKQGSAYTNPEIRELSDERRIKLAEIYAQVPAAGVGITGSYNAYLTNLKEIKLYLSNDLTPKGVAAMNPIEKKAAVDLDALKQSLQPLLAALDGIKAELYSGKK